MRLNRSNVTLEEVKAALDYNPDTGIFVWKWRSDVPPKVNGRDAGQEAGSMVGAYREIHFNGRKCLSHILAWFYMTGNWPERFIDHKDQNKTNNKWDNLRLATKGQNSMNRGVQPNNKLGFRGVCESFGKYEALVAMNGKKVFRRRFDTVEEAVYWRDYAVQYHHKEFASAA